MGETAASPPVLLGLDAGGSATKWILQRGLTLLESGSAPPLTAALLRQPQGAATATELAAALPERPDALHAGISGLGTAATQVQVVRQVLARAFHLPPTRIGLENDLHLAYRAFYPPGAGILLYAGTGSIAYHLSAQDQVIRAGGYGYRIGDDGGGFSLGRAALRWLTDQFDEGHTPDTPLTRQMQAVTGGLDWDTVRAFVYAAPGAASVASLAPAIGKAADQGDPTALHLLEDAAHALAELARRIQARVGSLPISATGGALRISEHFPQALTRHLPGVRIEWRDHAQVAAETATKLLKG